MLWAWIYYWVKAQTGVGNASPANFMQRLRATSLVRT